MRDALGRGIGLVTGALSLLTVGGGAAWAQTAELRLTDTLTATVVTVIDQMPPDGDPLPGRIIYSGPVGTNWTLNVTTGVSKPASGSATQPHLSLSSVDATSLGAGTLMIEFSDTDFGPLASSLFQASTGGTSDGTMVVDGFLDAANVVFAATTSLTDQGPFGPGAFNDTALSGAVTAAFPYSVTQRLVITHSAAMQITSFGAELSSLPPENLPTTTPTDTPTATPTITVTDTPTDTPTTTPTDTPTTTPTDTPTDTPTPTPTITSTPPNGGLPTVTPSSTPTPRSTPTPGMTVPTMAPPSLTLLVASLILVGLISLVRFISTPK